MKGRVATTITTAIACTILATGCARQLRATVPELAKAIGDQAEWQEEFGFSKKNLGPTGRNPYFVLEPGFQIVLEGNTEKVSITVLDETAQVAGVTTRVVEEREWKNGELVEVSRNFFAIHAKTQDVFYFGEEVDMYNNGELVAHTGAWRAGEDRARPGMIMPGQPYVGQKHYQELAPGAAMDRAEVVSLEETLETPAGVFSDCLKTHETTALNPLESEFKTYAPGIGLIQDAGLLLSEYGYVGQ
jgi:hypothetical protein